MWDTLYKKMNLEKKAKKITSNSEKEKTIRVGDVEDEMEFKIYNLFNGVYLMFLNVNTDECSSIFKEGSNLLLINHCKHGIMQYQTQSKENLSLHTGDVEVGRKKNKIEKLVFPSQRYLGSMIIIEEEQLEAPKEFSNKVLNFKKKYCQKACSSKISDVEPIEYIFSEIYEAPNKVKEKYYKMKIIELLLYLEAYDKEAKKDVYESVAINKIEKMELIHDFLVNNISDVYTIEDLSRKFNISPTSLKSCFKKVYKASIFAYMRSYRINYAAQMLRNDENMKIIDVAGMVGYDSPSKFSVAFKKEKGLTPREYRRCFAEI